MFRIPENDWQEQIQKNERQKSIEEMIDARINHSGGKVNKEQPQLHKQYGKHFVSIPEKNWSEQIRAAERKKILEEMIAERRNLKGDSRPQFHNKDQKGMVSIPENNWQEQIQKEKDNEALNELLAEYTLSRSYQFK